MNVCDKTIEVSLVAVTCQLGVVVYVDMDVTIVSSYAVDYSTERSSLYSLCGTRN
jgi:hypothetical protein